MGSKVWLRVVGCGALASAAAVAVSAPVGAAETGSDDVATIRYSTLSKRIIYSGTNADNTLEVSTHYFGYKVQDHAGAIDAGEGCWQFGEDAALCGFRRNNVERLFFDLRSGNDTLIAHDAMDAVVYGGPGNDRVSREAGSAGGKSQLAFSGGSGIDTADYERIGKPVTITLNDRFDDGAEGDEDYLAADIENLVGSVYDDFINGSQGDNKIYPNGGADIVHASKGDDSIYGTRKEDTVYCSDGYDTLFGLAYIPMNDCERVYRE